MTETFIDLRLPPEIEYEIFVFAFYNDPKCETTLLRVAKHVYEWLLPLLYNSIMISSKFMKDKFPNRTAIERHGYHVHNLLVMSRVLEQLDIPFTTSDLLLSCPNVTNLAIWFGSTPPPNILDLPVRRLALESFGFLEDKFDNNPKEKRLVQWCSNITHLAIGTTLYGGANRHIVHFPALEYLMVFQGSDCCGFVMSALTRYPRLKVAVRLMGLVSDHAQTLLVPDVPDEDEDIRIVRLDAYFVEDWYRGTQGLDDIWSVAEWEVERRRGNVTSDRY